ncbi:MAG: hypothetical protein IPI64_06615 [Chloracidobacterium sp.]|nr:hypothetical protein [Chloracidobacterium sp.]
MAANSVSQLLSHQQENSLLDVIDDCSTEDISSLIELIETPPLYPDRQRTITVNTNNLGAKISNIGRLNAETYDTQGLVYLSDDDVVLSQRFGLELAKLIALMRNDPDIFAASLFNVHNPWHLETEDYGVNHVCKSSFGSVSMLIRAKDFRGAVDHYLTPDYDGISGCDWSICHFAKKLNKKLVATRMSYIQHIGLYGVNNSPLVNDFADNFVE